MKSFARKLGPYAILFFLLFAPLTSAQPRDSPSADAGAASISMDASSFAKELHRLQSVIQENQAAPGQIAQIRTSLPDQWYVRTADGSYEISSAPLRTLLEKAEQYPQRSPNLIRAANQWLAEEARQIESYTAAEPIDGLSARAALTTILARREFRGLGRTSARDILMQKFQDWMEKIWEWFVGHIGRHETGAKIFFELLLFLAVVWLGAVLVRFWTRRARFDELRAPQSVAIARSWQEWIRAAREASERGDFREAVHSAYWAGIAYLEAIELIAPDRTRTPREYVRLLSKPRPDIATPLEQPRAALAALTARLEQVWYGHRPASREDYAESMRHVEGLGCQLH
ncbi:MAG: DUF4129 domain-containing protein [Candidatus Acidiferrales bacterium]